VVWLLKGHHVLQVALLAPTAAVCQQQVKLNQTGSNLVNWVKVEAIHVLQATFLATTGVDVTAVAAQAHVVPYYVMWWPLTPKHTYMALANDKHQQRLLCSTAGLLLASLQHADNGLTAQLTMILTGTSTTFS
jgi:hypothetical protein